jgi:hypothetical protein
MSLCRDFRFVHTLLVIPLLKSGDPGDAEVYSTPIVHSEAD